MDQKEKKKKRREKKRKEKETKQKGEKPFSCSFILGLNPRTNT